MEKNNSSWKLCMKSWNISSIGMEIMAIVFLVVITAFPFVLGAMEREPVPLFAAIGAPVLGMMNFLFFSFGVVFERRRFQMNEEGITILYCGRIRRFYPWTMFQKIVVCDVSHTTKFPDNCSVVIRLAAMEEPCGPHSKKQKYNISGIASWRKYNYSIRNFSKILLQWWDKDTSIGMQCFVNCRCTDWPFKTSYEKIHCILLDYAKCVAVNLFHCRNISISL